MFVDINQNKDEENTKRKRNWKRKKMVKPKNIYMKQ